MVEIINQRLTELKNELQHALPVMAARWQQWQWWQWQCHAICWWRWGGSVCSAEYTTRTNSSGVLNLLSWWTALAHAKRLCISNRGVTWDGLEDVDMWIVGQWDSQWQWQLLTSKLQSVQFKAETWDIACQSQKEVPTPLQIFSHDGKGTKNGNLRDWNWCRIHQCYLHCWKRVFEDTHKLCVWKQRSASRKMGNLNGSKKVARSSLLKNGTEQDKANLPPEQMHPTGLINSGWNKPHSDRRQVCHHLNLTSGHARGQANAEGQLPDLCDSLTPVAIAHTQWIEEQVAAEMADTIQQEQNEARRVQHIGIAQGDGTTVHVGPSLCKTNISSNLAAVTHLENVLPLIQCANFCMDNYDHWISNDWIFGYALFFCARTECAMIKQAFSGYALLIIE